MPSIKTYIDLLERLQSVNVGALTRSAALPYATAISHAGAVPKHAHRAASA